MPVTIATSKRPLGVEDLKRKLRADWRGTLVTTIQSFQNMGDLAPLTRDNIISMVDECHRSQKGDGKESFAMTMRVKLANGIRFGFSGTPIDRTMQNTHRDFGPQKDGVQERYLTYYGIRRAIQDGATLEVHYVRDKVPFSVDEKALSTGFEEMCAEMELEDEGAKNFVQRQRAQWKELARHLAAAAIRLGQHPHRVYVMGQRTKWGNCSALRNLSFNWRLIQAPCYA
jgi:type I restriction enzyme, R subunit